MKVIAFGSGKGGVGKSLVSASVVVEMASRGLKVGLLDLDLHGPTQHLLFPTEGKFKADRSGIKPFTPISGVKVFSLGYLFKQEPLPIKGKEKYGMVLDFSWLIDWDDIDFLVVDLPPGTGDEHLAMLRALKAPKIYLVSLPSEESTSVVRRAYRLYEGEGFKPEGLVLNMCWLECNGSKVYPFGKDYRPSDMPVLVELPLEPNLSKKPLRKEENRYWEGIAKLVDRILSKS